MTETDIAAVMAIQASCYVSAMVEPEAVIRARLQACAGHAWVAGGAEGIAAYLMAYPSRVGRVTPLGGAFSVAEQADCLYLHDLAVAPASAGAGLGKSLVEAAEAAARRAGLARMALVSVQDSLRYWQRQGFQAWAALDAEQRARLDGYAGPACYMVRQLDQSEAKGESC
jgi:GNAT superfamily N-acetyltransferase